MTKLPLFAFYYGLTVEFGGQHLAAKYNINLEEENASSLRNNGS